MTCEVKTCKLKKEIIERIERFLSHNEDFSGQPVSEVQLSDAEQQLGINLNSDYKEFVSLFGGSYVGVPVYGFNNCKMLSTVTMTELTISFREAYKADGRWPVLEHSCVISITGSGDPVIINDQGNVVAYYHDTNEEEVLAESFQDLIEQNMLE